MERYKTKNLVASSIITGVELACFIVLSILTLLASKGHSAFIVGVSLILCFGSLYLLLKTITLALYNTRAKRALDAIAKSLELLTLMALSYPLSFGVKSFACGWVAFSLITLWAVLTLIYKCIFYLKYWRWSYAVSVVTLLVCMILLATGKVLNTYFIIAFIMGLITYWLANKAPRYLWLACLLELIMFSLWFFGLMALVN